MSQIALHFSRRPRRTALVLLPPFPLDARVWDGALEQLADLPVITVDPPGFGDSAAPDELAAALGAPEEPALETYARGVLAALQQAGVERIVLAGVSIGGYSAMTFAELFPERLVGLGLLDTSAEADTEQKVTDRLAMASSVEEGTPTADILVPTIPSMVSPVTPEQRPELHAQLLEWYANVPAGGVVWSQRAMAARPARLGVLEGLEVPSLVLRGADDAVSSAESAQAMASALDTEVVEIPDAGHMAAVETPETVAAALRDLWERATRYAQEQAADAEGQAADAED